MRFRRLIWAGMGAAVIAAITTFPSFAAGWQHNDSGYWFEREDKSYPAGTWEQIEGKWYLFDQNGYMLTGWQQVGEVWYYLGTDGAMAADTVMTIDGAVYAFDSSGAMKEQPGNTPVTGHFEGSTFVNEWSNIRLTIPQGFITMDAELMSQMYGDDPIIDGAVMDMAALRNENCGIMIFYVPTEGQDAANGAMAFLNMFMGGSHTVEGGGTVKNVQVGSIQYLRFYFPPTEKEPVSGYMYLRSVDGYYSIILTLSDTSGASYTDAALSTLATAR